MKKTYNIYRYGKQDLLTYSGDYYNPTSLTEVDVEVFELIGEFETYEKAYEHLEILCENKTTSSKNYEETYTILECFKF